MFSILFKHLSICQKPKIILSFETKIVTNNLQIVETNLKGIILLNQLFVPQFMFDMEQT